MAKFVLFRQIFVRTFKFYFRGTNSRCWSNHKCDFSITGRLSNMSQIILMNRFRTWTILIRTFPGRYMWRGKISIWLQAFYLQLENPNFFTNVFLEIFLWQWGSHKKLFDKKAIAFFWKYCWCLWWKTFLLIGRLAAYSFTKSGIFRHRRHSLEVFQDIIVFVLIRANSDKSFSSFAFLMDSIRLNF